MTVKSVIDVDINDGAFKKFAALFDKYQQALSKTPEQWAKVEKSAAGTALTAETLVAALAAHARATKLATDEQRKAKEEQQRMADEARRTEISWSKITGWSQGFARNIAGATSAILKWTTITTALTGVAGIGSLYGLDRLGSDVGYNRRGAQGFGVSYGEQRSFGVNYGRLVDTGSFLGGVNSALTDVTQRSALYGAGLTDSDLSGKDTAQVASLLLPRLKALADRTPNSQLGQLLSSRGLDRLGVSVQDLERLKATSPGELGGIAASYKAGVGAFNLQDATAKKWQDLDVQLTAAKTNIENVFVRGLTPLVPALEKFSQSVVKAVATFFSNPNLNQDIEDFGKGIETFAKYLGSKKFTDDVKTFADDVAYAAAKITGALKWLGLLPGSTSNTSHPVLNTVEGAGAGAVVGAGIGAFGGPIGAGVGAALGALLGY